MHQENGIIVIDDNFQTKDEKEFQKKVYELYEKCHVASTTPSGLPRIKQERISHFDNLFKNKKIELTNRDLKFFQ